MSRTTVAEAPADPACPLVARRVPFEAIPHATWASLLARTACATPFSRWSWHKAWWEAYGAGAHEDYLVCSPADSGEEASSELTMARGIVPLMHRHAVEADDVASATMLRHTPAPPLDGIAPDAKVIFFAASYHADYATLLCDPADLDDVAQATAQALTRPSDSAHGAQPWDLVDLRRLRADDPALSALERAFVTVAGPRHWRVRRELEDVCPVVTVPEGLDFEAYLATLAKKDRHEIRRKVRRVAAAGPAEFQLVEPTPEAVERFVELHRARWGEKGLFPAKIGGERSRRFVHRLAELERASGRDRQLELGTYAVAGRVIFASLGFDDGTTCYLYNAGIDPAARDLSPGVTGTAAYLAYKLERGRRRFDFLRGAEPYKYEWGAVDEPVERLILSRERAA